MNQITKLGVASLAAASLFAVGCGDETTNITENKTGIVAYESDKFLPDCDSSTVGEMALLESTGKVVYCADNEWTELNGKNGEKGADGKKGDTGKQGEDGESCTVKPLKDKSGYKVICGGDSLGVILHGEKGATGAQGKQGIQGEQGKQGIQGVQGAAGTSCTVQPVKLSAESDSTTGFNILCGGQKVGYVVNGIDGIGCKLADDYSGQVFVTCGDEEPTAIFKAMCGTKFYDPEYAICNEGVLTETCNGNPLTEGKFCYNKKQYDLCNGAKYNPETQICMADKNSDQFVIGACPMQVDIELVELLSVELFEIKEFNGLGGQAQSIGDYLKPSPNGDGFIIYDVTKYFCSTDTLSALCGGKSYNLTSQYCKDNKVTNKLKCGNVYFTEADKKFCFEGELYDYCDGKTYTPSTELCVENKVVAKVKCGEIYYNASEKFCENSTLYDLCGGKTFNPATEECKAGVVTTIPKCGNEIYDPETQICTDGKIEAIPLCDGKAFDPAQKFCDNKTLYDLCGGKSYNPAEQFCATNNKIYSKCGGLTYNPNTQKCQFGDVIDKVGEYEYGSLYDSRDGQIYLTVQIGTQTWMAENLNYRKVFSDADSNSYCFEGFSGDSYCENYGRLYTWAAAVDSTRNADPGYGKVASLSKKQGVCPIDWHLPSQDEWVTMLSYIATQNGETFTKEDYEGANIAKYLKSSGNNSTWNIGAYSDDVDPMDLYGFSAISGGRMVLNFPVNLSDNSKDYYSDNGNQELEDIYYIDYDNLGYATNFWTSTQDGESNANAINLYDGQSFVDPTYNMEKRFGAYVRCVKN